MGNNGTLRNWNSPAGRVTRLVWVSLALGFTTIAAGAQAQTFKVLFKFHGPDGQAPAARLFMDNAGNLYGSTSNGGTVTTGCPVQDPPTPCGTVFKLDSSGKETVLRNFSKKESDGTVPFGSVTLDPEGNIYGTTNQGGYTGNQYCSPNGCAVVFEIDTNGRYKVLHRFTGPPDGAFPNEVNLLWFDGLLYGVTPFGGTGTSCGLSSGCGTVFKINPKTGKETILYQFSGGTDGAVPSVGLMRDKAGNFYGTTRYGGTGNCDAYPGTGCGVVYKLDPHGNETVLYDFAGQQDGKYPWSVPV